MAALTMADGSKERAKMENRFEVDLSRQQVDATQDATS
jgi:hypothetical protein